MKKISFFLLVLLMVVTTSGCRDQDQQKLTKYYNSSSVFFNYPDTWDVARSIDVGGVEAVIVTDPTASKYINESTAIEDLESLNITDGTVFIYLKIPKTPDASLNSTVAEVQERLMQKGGNITNTTTTSVSGIAANETSLTRTSEGVISEAKIIAFEKNDSIYALILVTAGHAYESQKNNFDMILSSLQFK